MKYLAFDFGDGSTCAAMCVNGEREPEIRHIVRGMGEIWSTLTYNDNEKPVVGKILLPGGALSEIKTNWKGRPSKMDGDQRKVAVDFMRTCFCKYVENNKCDYFDKLIVGVPSDWITSDRDSVVGQVVNEVSAYKEMVREAWQKMRDLDLGSEYKAQCPEEIKVVAFPESQAAVLYMRAFRENEISIKNLEDGVLAIDVGSSTTDFTYIKGLTAIHGGLSLGAKYVERSFIADAMKREAYVYGNGLNGDAYDRLHAREYKESYFRNCDAGCASAPTFGLPNSRLIIGDVIEKGVRGEINPQVIERCLSEKDGIKFRLSELSSMWDNTNLKNENSFRGHFRAALLYVKSLWKLDSEKLTVYLTGGATRMQFIQEDVCAAFDRKLKIVQGLDNNKTFSVVKGLAWAGYVTDAISVEKRGLESKVDSLLKEDEVVNRINESIIAPIAKSVAGKLVEQVRGEMQSYPETLNTKRKIANFAQNKARTILMDSINIEEINQVAYAILDMEKMKNIFDDIRRKIGNSVVSLQMPKIEIVEASIGALGGLDIDFDEIFGQIITAMVLVFLIAVGPLGWVGALALAGLSAVGLSAFLEKGPDEELSADAIKKAAEKVSVSDVEVKLNDAFRASGNGKSFTQEIQDVIKRKIIYCKNVELDALAGIFEYKSDGKV